jgi:hypothetical protein
MNINTPSKPSRLTGDPTGRSGNIKPTTTNYQRKVDHSGRRGCRSG